MYDIYVCNKNEHMGNMPSMPSIPTMSTMPTMPANPAMPSMPSIPTMPAMPAMPVMPANPAMPVNPSTNQQINLNDTTKKLNDLLSKLNLSNQPQLAQNVSNLMAALNQTGNTLNTNVQTNVANSANNLVNQATNYVSNMNNSLNNPLSNNQLPNDQLPNNQLPDVSECTSCQVPSSQPSAPSTQNLLNNQDIKMVTNENNFNGYTYKPVRKYSSTGNRMEDGLMTSEMSYTDYNSIPLGQNLDTMEKDFSYTFLPPDRWYPVPPHPPICVAEKECPVCPVIVLSNSGAADLKEWESSTRITPGDQINTKYINEKINSGR